MASPSSPPPVKPEFWRIHDIKKSEKGAAREWLEEQVKELAISEGQGFSLAADDEETLCATLTSFERPTPANSSWHVDKNFTGFTPLCDPEGASVDIVAVTGLGGHALGSFRSAEGALVWLRDFAPKDIPQARFITYGYDSAVLASESKQGVADLAHTLLDGLDIFRRRTQTQKRPLCFVCHSLGGIVLKEALVKSTKATEHPDLYQICIATCGLVLMGVPNLGLRHDQLGTVVKGQPNEALIRDLLVQSDTEPSQFLRRLTEEFAHACKQVQPAWKIISYYETMRSSTVAASEGGRFAMTGPKEFMVTKGSAERISNQVRDVDHLPSNTDHRGLVRFEHSHDDRYISVIEKLKSMVTGAAARDTCLAKKLPREADQQAIAESGSASQSVRPLKYLPSRNRQFIGRTAELETLERKLFVERDCQRMAVVGLGGIGKTQVVLHFAYLVFEKHPDVSVFWVPALSAEAFEQAYREIARVLGMDSVADGKDDVKELVRQNLDARTGGKWLLVVDNADDMDILEGERGLLHYLPEGDSGLTIFTTRSSKVAQLRVGSNVVELGNLTEPEAVKVLRLSLNRKDLLHDEAITTELLVELDYLPLAIIQATAYINCNKVSLLEYLDLLKGTEQDVVHIMSTEIRDNTKYGQAANAVATTWLVSFQQILERDGDAATILQYMACIEWKAIPHSILPAIQSAALMTAAVGTLCSYSFVTRRDGERKYDMHRLVHLAARNWMRQRGSLVETQRKAIQHLLNIFPSEDYNNREVWREYILHAARMSKDEQGEDVEARGTLCLKVGRCLHVDGRIKDAVGWLNQSFNSREHLTEDHPDRLASQHALAVAYETNGQVAEAVQLLEHVVATRKRVLAEDHPDRLASQHALAVAYETNGQVAEAVQLLEHVVAIEAGVLAEDHPDRLASQHALARAYRANGQVAEAVQLLEHVVATRKRVLAEDHPDRLASQRALAMAQLSQQSTNCR